MPLGGVMDDQLAWALFQQHLNTCASCTPKGECPEGHRILMAWGRADAAAGNQVIGEPSDV